MKKILFLAAFCAASILWAQQMEINGDFKGSKLHDYTPKGWNKGGGANNPNVGESAIVRGQKGKLRLEVQPGKQITSFYYHKSTPCKAGDQITIRATASGKGKFILLYYGYNSKNSNFDNKSSQVFTLTDKPTEYKAVLDVKDTVRGKIAGVRIAFDIQPNTTIIIDSINAELKKAPAK